MDKLLQFFRQQNKIIFLALLFLCLFPFVTPPIALLCGLCCSFLCGNPYPVQTQKISKYLLQYSVVGLGFGMNFFSAVATGSTGILFTIASVVLVLALGWFLGKRLLVDRKTAYLISSGTAICGGSAIAAISSVIRADKNQITIAIASIFILNSIALFVFPPLGHLLNMTQEQFGTWAAIAIHDTSSVVGAGASFGEKALEVATTVKLTRTLWIIPLSIFTGFVFKTPSRKVKIPWFILFFIIAMLLNTFIPLPEILPKSIVWLARRGLVLSLFLIGSGLSIEVFKQVGFKALLLAILLWAAIGIFSLGAIMLIQ